MLSNISLVFPSVHFRSAWDAVIPSTLAVLFAPLISGEGSGSGITDAVVAPAGSVNHPVVLVFVVFHPSVVAPVVFDPSVVPFVSTVYFFPSRSYRQASFKAVESYTGTQTSGA